VFPNAYLVQPSHTFRYEAAKNFEFRFQRGEDYPGWLIRDSLPVEHEKGKTTADSSAPLRYGRDDSVWGKGPNASHS